MTYTYAGREVVFLPVGSDEAGSLRFVEAIEEIFFPASEDAAVRLASRPVYVPVGEAEDSAQWRERFLSRLVRLPRQVDFIFRTSGSTRAGGHLVGHSRASLLQSALVGAQVLGPGGPWVAALPMEHIGGFLPVLRSLLAGYRPLIVDRSQGFSPVIFASLALAQAKENADPFYVSLVPTQLKKGWDLPSFREALKVFSAVLVGGGPCEAAFLDEVRESGVKLVTSYGMTETCGGTAYNARALPACEFIIEPWGAEPESGAKVALARPGSAQGLAPVRSVKSGTGAKIAGLGQGKTGGTGKPVSGRILQRCPWVMVGYLESEEDSFVLDAKGLRVLPTNDMGRIVDGKLEVLGRIDDVVVSGGVNLSTGEITARALADSRVRERFSQLWFGAQQDEKWGQSLLAVGVLRDPGAFTALPAYYSKDCPLHAQLLNADQETNPQLKQVLWARDNLEFLRSGLAGYLPPSHLPRALLLLPELPMLASGKPDRMGIYSLLALARDRARELHRELGES